MYSRCYCDQPKTAGIEHHSDVRGWRGALSTSQLREQSLQNDTFPPRFLLTEFEVGNMSCLVPRSLASLRMPSLTSRIIDEPTPVGILGSERQIPTVAYRTWNRDPAMQRDVTENCLQFNSSAWTSLFLTIILAVPPEWHLGGV